MRDLENEPITWDRTSLYACLCCPSNYYIPRESVN